MPSVRNRPLAQRSLPSHGAGVIIPFYTLNSPMAKPCIVRSTFSCPTSHFGTIKPHFDHISTHGQVGGRSEVTGRALGGSARWRVGRGGSGRSAVVLPYSMRLAVKPRSIIDTSPSAVAFTISDSLGLNSSERGRAPASVLITTSRFEPLSSNA